MTIEILKARLSNYPGPRPNETWKLQKDLTKCTPREKEELHKLGITVEQLMAAGFDRGMVAHALWGYKHTRKRSE